MLLDATDMVDKLKPARNRKMKRSSEKLPTSSRNTMKGEITQCVKSFTKVTKP